MPVNFSPFFSEFDAKLNDVILTASENSTPKSKSNAIPVTGHEGP
jgi:hypothetical protein